MNPVEREGWPRAAVSGGRPEGEHPLLHTKGIATLHPLAGHFVTTARTNPRLLHIDDGYDEYLWNLREDEIAGNSRCGSAKHALDLDKSFGDLQSLWHTEPPLHRPAIELVRGQVTDTHRGWKPHYGIIDPDRVSAVRDDVRATRDDDIVVFVESGGGRYRDEPQLYIRSLIAFRDKILPFLDERANRGEGVLYTIG